MLHAGTEGDQDGKGVWAWQGRMKHQDKKVAEILKKVGEVSTQVNTKTDALREEIQAILMPLPGSLVSFEPSKLALVSGTIR